MWTTTPQPNGFGREEWPEWTALRAATDDSRLVERGSIYGASTHAGPAQSFVPRADFTPVGTPAIFDLEHTPRGSRKVLEDLSTEELAAGLTSLGLHMAGEAARHYKVDGFVMAQLTAVGFERMFEDLQITRPEDMMEVARWRANSTLPPAQTPHLAPASPALRARARKCTRAHARARARTSICSDDESWPS